ncbi:MAG: Mth938-like domain-containing protein [Candidatus Bathyarchaeia archaeon]
MIESYNFGEMVIKGKKYTSDVIVFPERVIDGWWRLEGHSLCLEDLKEVLSQDPKPELIVVGTGYYGFMKVPADVESALKSKGINVIAQPTGEACKTYNKLLNGGKRVVGAFHLTC